LGELQLRSGLPKVPGLDATNIRRVQTPERLDRHEILEENGGFFDHTAPAFFLNN
jgi:hypothetical protein